MIVPMKKANLIVMHVHLQDSLEKLRNAGVLHVEQVPAGNGERYESFRLESDRAAAALAVLNTSLKDEKDEDDQILSREAADRGVRDILELAERKKALQAELIRIDLDMEIMRPFGEIEPADLEILRSQEIDIRIIEGGAELEQRLKAAGAVAFTLSRKKRTSVYAAVFLGEAPHDIMSEAVSLPSYGVLELESMKRERIAELDEVTARIDEHSRKIDWYRKLSEAIAQDLEFESLSTGLDGEADLSWLSGYIPENRTEGLSALAAQEGWGLVLREPSMDDDVPTLVQNNKTVRIIAPVFKFLGTVPGYREYDISSYFLAYFSVFFAMIIGDGGYGLVFLGLALAMTFKAAGKGTGVPDALKLLFLLSTSTIVWGALTGNWFGSRLIASREPLRSITIPAIATFPDLFPGMEVDPQSTVMWMCFILGLSQLTLANLMNFLRTFPRLKALSHLGWGMLIGGLYFLVLTFVLGAELPQFSPPVVVAGLVLIVVFGEQEPEQSFGKGLARGLGGAFSTFLDSISGFANIISYIRLFAVGMSSFHIASSFNDLASPMLSGFLIPFGVLVIVFGHGLNLVMAILSVVVHGVRLNMLEFSGQLGMQWTGIEYEPFRVRVTQENTVQGVPS